MRALRLVNQLWVIVPVIPRKNRASSELLYKSNRTQVSLDYRLINLRLVVYEFFECSTNIPSGLSAFITHPLIFE